jgi:hypothetical protein
MRAYIFTEIWESHPQCCTTMTWAAFTITWASPTLHATTCRELCRRMRWPWRVFQKQSQVCDTWVSHLETPALCLEQCLDSIWKPKCYEQILIWIELLVMSHWNIVDAWLAFFLFILNVPVLVLSLDTSCPSFLQSLQATGIVNVTWGSHGGDCEDGCLLGCSAM